MLVVLLLAAVFGYWVWNNGAEQRALRRMPHVQRAALYQQTRATTASLCSQAARDPALRDRCADSAEFLLTFPECDAACQAFARPFIAQSAR